jgi:signal transduction histidine kinase
MDFPINLIAHNAISILSTLTLLGMAFFTFLNGRDKVANTTWALMMLAISIFTISHVIGVNTVDPHISKIVLMFNLSIFFIAAFNLHSVLAFVGLDQKKKWVIRLTYGVTFLLVVFFIVFPNLFLIDSVPKMYFPNYYEPGVLNWIRVAFLYGIIVPYCLILLYNKRATLPNPTEKNRCTYLILTMIIGYTLGFIPNLLIYDITIDPLWGMSFSTIFSIFFTYGAIRYGLFDIKVIAKQALLYSSAVVLVGIVIVLFNYSNQWIVTTFPNFPIWISPFISSLAVVTLGFIVWQHSRQGDILKYEFITTVTHKFRTPLTHIKWASENLSNDRLSPDDRMQVEYIQNANSKLVELTNLLVNVSEAENNIYDYKIEKGDISALVKYVTDSLASQSISKHINIIKRIEPGIQTMHDDHRIRFVVQTFVENALNYTNSGGTLTVVLKREGLVVTCSVTDTGMGISNEELPLLFSKFYRAQSAKLADTEGMGIGLFMSKEVIHRHGGKIWAESPGPNKGSTFSFSLPITN